jgi:hypothetical protein
MIVFIKMRIYGKIEREMNGIRTHQSFGSETGAGSDETTEIADP